MKYTEMCLLVPQSNTESDTSVSLERGFICFLWKMPQVGLQPLPLLSFLFSFVTHWVHKTGDEKWRSTASYKMRHFSWWRMYKPLLGIIRNASFLLMTHVQTFVRYHTKCIISHDDAWTNLCYASYLMMIQVQAVVLYRFHGNACTSRCYASCPW